MIRRVLSVAGLSLIAGTAMAADTKIGFIYVGPPADYG